MHEGYESYPVDNLFGAICGVVAIIGGGIGSGIICSDKLTSKSSLMQAFLTFSIVGFLFSWMVALYNFNWTFIFARYVFDSGWEDPLDRIYLLTVRFSDTRNMWTPILASRYPWWAWLEFYESSKTAEIIMFSMHLVSAALNSINGIIQWTEYKLYYIIVLSYV